jgi:hypothetical protein
MDIDTMIAAFKAAGDAPGAEKKQALEEAVRVFLTGYAWLDDTDEEKQREIDCIIAQGGWEFASALADKFAGAQFEPGPEAFADGMGMALTGLYECHDEPHLPACPRNRGG